MALLKVRCPECNAPLKSSTGFTVGDAVSCPKCETDFTVKEPDEEFDDATTRLKDADAADDENEEPRKKKKKQEDDEDGEPVRRSYKDSPLRYAVLGVLVVVMLVLAYMLYLKTKREREAAEADNASNSNTADEPLFPPGGPAPPPKGAPTGVGPGGPGGPKLPGPPKGPTIAEAKSRLVGAWECKLSGAVYTVAYKADGTFTYTATPTDEPAKTITGRWTAERLEQVTIPAPGMPQQTLMRMEWTIDQQPPLKEAVVFRLDQKLQHPLLEQLKDGTAVPAIFTRK